MAQIAKDQQRFRHFLLSSLTVRFSLTSDGRTECILLIPSSTVRHIDGESGE